MHGTHCCKPHVNTSTCDKQWYTKTASTNIQVQGAQRTPGHLITMLHTNMLPAAVLTANGQRPETPQTRPLQPLQLHNLLQTPV